MYFLSYQKRTKIIQKYTMSLAFIKTFILDKRNDLNNIFKAKSPTLVIFKSLKFLKVNNFYKDYLLMMLDDCIFHRAVL